jgi:ABC-2 type transport system ATP-binding protein
VLVEEKAALIQKLGRKQLTLQLHTPLAQVPELLAPFSLALADEGATLVYTYDSTAREEGEHGIAALLSTLKTANIRVKDLSTRQSSLEDIFVDLIKEGA